MLIYAAMSGHVEVSQFLLMWRADPNMKGEKGETALHCAAQNGYRHVVAALCQSECNVNAQNTLGQTAAHHAMHAKTRGVVRCLLNARADPSIADADGNTPLHLANHRTNPEDINAILSTDANVVHMLNNGGLTPLHTAAKEGAHTVVKALLEGIQDPSASTFLWQSLLGSACAEAPIPDPDKPCYLSCVTLLLDARAEADLLTRKAGFDHPVLRQLIGTEDDLSGKSACRESFRCAICMEQERCMLFQPCLHLVCCWECSQKVTCCPYDRQEIESMMTIKIAG